VDLRAIKAAERTELSACAVAAARNTQGLLHDAAGGVAAVGPPETSVTSGPAGVIVLP
jgi:hypothetical protein